MAAYDLGSSLAPAALCQKCTRKGIGRQGIVLEHRNSLQKEHVPCRHMPCSSDFVDALQGQGSRGPEAIAHSQLAPLLLPTLPDIRSTHPTCTQAAALVELQASCTFRTTLARLLFYYVILYYILLYSILFYYIRLYCIIFDSILSVPTGDPLLRNRVEQVESVLAKNLRHATPTDDILCTWTHFDDIHTHKHGISYN